MCRLQPPGRRLRDSPTHMLVDCPAYAAARQLLADVWPLAFGSGHASPLRAAIAAMLIGDSAAAWTAHAQGDLQCLWPAIFLALLVATRVRVRVLVVHVLAVRAAPATLRNAVIGSQG